MRGTPSTTAAFKVEKGGHQPGNADGLSDLGTWAAGSGLQLAASKATGPQFYNLKSLNSISNLNEQGKHSPLAAPERDVRNSALQTLGFSLVRPKSYF